MKVSGTSILTTSQNNQEPTVNQRAVRMERRGDVYVGDINGDGIEDEWNGRFNALSPYGIGEFRFGNLHPGALPQMFKNSSGTEIELGDKVIVDNGYETQDKQDVISWNLNVTKGQNSIQPDHILVSVSFYTETASQGLGQRHSIESVVIN